MHNISDKEVFRIFGQKISPKSFMSVVSTEGISVHFGQSAEDAILMRLFDKKNDGFYVDVGAFHPRKYSNTFLFYKYLNWRGINIDASKEAIKLFEQERPDDINVQVAVGLNHTEATYYMFNYPARNTLSESNRDRQLSRQDAQIVGEEIVKVVPLVEILNQYVPENTSIDLLNIDVEGLELSVLQSNDWDRYKPSVILVEDYAIKDSGRDQSDIHRFLNQYDYQLVSHCFDTSIYVLGGEINLKKGSYDRKIITSNKEDDKTKNRSRYLAQTILKKDLSTMKEQIERLEQQKSIIKEDIATINERTKRLEHQHSILSDNVISMKEQYEALEQQNSMLEEKIRMMSIKINDTQRENDHLQVEISKALVEIRRQRELIDLLEEYHTILKEKENRKKQLIKIKKEVRKNQGVNHQIKRDLRRYKNLCKEIENSNSWRLTAPLRSIVSRLRNA